MSEDVYMMMALQSRDAVRHALERDGGSYIVADGTGYSVWKDDEQALSFLMHVLIKLRHDRKAVLANLSDLITWSMILAITPDMEYEPILGGVLDVSPEEARQYVGDDASFMDVHFLASGAMWWAMFMNRGIQGTVELMIEKGHVFEGMPSDEEE